MSEFRAAKELMLRDLWIEGYGLTEDGQECLLDLIKTMVDAGIDETMARKKVHTLISQTEKAQTVRNIVSQRNTFHITEKDINFFEKSR